MTEENLNIEQIVLTGDSNPDLRQRYNVEVREFVILACVCEAGQLNEKDIAIRVGLSPTTIRYCIDALAANALLVEDASSPAIVSATEDGRALIRQSGRSR